MHLLLHLNNRKVLFVFLFVFVFSFTKVNSNINNSIVVSVGNLPITYLDLIKEMKLISLLNNISVDNSNRETIKSVAVQGLITRKIKEMEIEKFKIKNYNKKDLEILVGRTSKNLGTNESGLEQLLSQKNLKLENLKERFKTDLKWNTLIFQLYNNKVIGVDSGLKRGKYGELFLIKDEQFFRATLSGKLIELK